ncbi:DUF1345 domain-containing protein [Spirosoma sordidisoli]|uniref:DUF1345 domain-containing protein n=1 Tax=Spirosoma sordidisoli TaxID=2502893 RepID=A0A4Q2UGE0_9BACT|nr:DUF1345 domain-containing protein [Spirosoma sordidisoli]RYC66451.1 DUF1345 domain-containing protein [Spirosoma sordidisoli]
MKTNRPYQPKLTALSRSLIAVIVGGLVWWLTAGRLGWQTRLLLGWLAYALTVLMMIWLVIGRADARQTAQREDESRPAIFLFTVGGALVSLLAVVVLLGSVKGLSASEATRHVILSGLTVVSSWLLMHSIFTLHYAHLYYYDANDTRQEGGLDFPGKQLPDYLDFAYFSFVVGMTCQVSDVAVTEQRLRRLTLLHSVLSFGFNTLIIALTINTVSGLF